MRKITRRTSISRRVRTYILARSKSVHDFCFQHLPETNGKCCQRFADIAFATYSDHLRFGKEYYDIPKETRFNVSVEKVVRRMWDIKLRRVPKNAGE